MLFPENEAERLVLVRQVAVEDPAPLKRISDAARRYFGVKMALVTIIDYATQNVLGCEPPFASTRREDSFCQYTILSGAPMIVEDARRDARFAQNVHVQGAPYIRFYAGQAISLGSGLNVGSFCLVDDAPRSQDAIDLEALMGFARCATSELWLQSSLRSAALSWSAAAQASASSTRPSGAQLRAGRALADWSIHDLASRSNVSVSTIKRMEGTPGDHVAAKSIIERILEAFRLEGISFHRGRAGQGVIRFDELPLH